MIAWWQGGGVRNQLQVIAEVSDKYGASSTAVATVIVKPSNSSTGLTIQSILSTLDKKAEIGNVEAVLQYTTAAFDVASRYKALTTASREFFTEKLLSHLVNASKLQVNTT